MATITEAQLTTWISQQTGVNSAIQKAIWDIWATTSGKAELSSVVNGNFSITFYYTENSTNVKTGSQHPLDPNNKLFDVYLTNYLTGIPVGDNQFATYDLPTMLSHELSHVISWSATEEEVAHMHNNDSYENAYTSVTNYFKNIAGLPFQLTRDGYNIGGYDNWSIDHGVDSWYDYDANKDKKPINATLYGGALDDTFVGGLGDETMYGGKGSDNLYGNNGNDTLTGGAGNDELHGEADEDTLWGGGNDDNLYGGSEYDILYGDSGIDTLSGGTGSDELYGGDGDDVLLGNDGYGSADSEADVLDGGSGYDTYVAGNGDTIYDSDGSGIIVFEGKVLHGVDVTMDSTIYPSNQDHTAYYSKADKGTYYRNGNYGFSFVSDSGKTLTVYSPLDYTEKIIPKPGGGTMKQKTYRGVGVILENFSSPLVLDLNHDGVTSIDLYATPAYFDMEKDGIREKTGWIQSTDALLAFDKNRDGIINDGSELFGNYTTLSNGTKASNGFEALAQYDNNHDGVIDKNDSAYNALSAWIDTNQDGVTDTGELHSLSTLGVTSINLNATATTAYEDQNAISHTSSFTQQTTDADGNTITETKTVNDVWFRKDTTNTLSTVTISDTVAALPQINGSGRVLDLHGAMQERTALKAAVETYLNSTAAYADQTTAIKNILSLWSNTDNISTTQARGEQWILNHNYANAQPVYRYRIYAFAKDVAILEQFAGTTFSMTTSDGTTTNDVVDSQMAQEMTNRLGDLIDTTMIRLLGQKLMGGAFYDANGQADYEVMFETITTIMVSGTQSQKETSATLIAAIIHRDGFESLNHFDQSLLNDSDFKTLLQTNGVTYMINADGTFSGSYADAVEGGSGDDILTATNNGTVYGGEGNDTIYGQNATDEHNNATGHEELHGGDGSDTIIGGTGDDILYGDAGNDTLYANTTSSGDGSYGHDVLIGGEGNDALIGTGRNSTYVYNYGDGNDTIIDGGNVGTTADVLELRNISFEDIRVERVGNDMVIHIKDIIDPESDIGSITIKNGMGSGKMESFVLDDMTLNFIQIQSANDTYTFSIGDGRRNINEREGIDSIVLGEGIQQDDLIIKQSGGDLMIGLKESETSFEELKDVITIKNWIYSDDNWTIRLNDGKVLRDNNIKSMIQNPLEMNALEFSVNSSVNFMDLSEAMQIKNSFSFGAWIKVSDTQQIDSQMTYRYAGVHGQQYAFGPRWGTEYPMSQNGFAGAGLSIGTNGISVYEHGGNFMPATAVYAAEIGNGFNHVVVVYKDKIPSIYLNGVLVHTGISSAAANVFAPLSFGGMGYGYMTGLMDEVVVYNKALSPDEVMLIHNGTLIPDNLVAHYSFDTQEKYEDTSGNVHTVSVEGAPELFTLKPFPFPSVPTEKGIEIIGDFIVIAIQEDVNGIATIRLDEAVSPEMLEIMWVQGSDDVQLFVKGDMKNSLLLKDWYVLQNKVIVFGDGTTWNTQDILDAMGNESDNVYNGLKDQSNVIHSGDGSDAVSTFDFDDMVYGEGGDDALDGGGGNDTLTGGIGDDLLFGGAGDDAYLFERGFGKDMIFDNPPDGTDAGMDRIVFGVDIGYSDLIVKSFEGDNNLYIALAENGTSYNELSDMITIKDWYVQNNRIETIVLEDSTQISILELLRTKASDAGEAITALAEGGGLNGTEGGDTLIGNVGDDFILGLGGNDTLEGSDGSDTLIGGGGDDSLDGGAGDDLYFFGRGDGRDTIYDNATAVQEQYGYVVDADGVKRWGRIEQEYAIQGGEDTLYFGDKILPADLSVSNDGYDLVISLKNAPADTMRIRDYYKPFNTIEYFGFSNGTTIEKAQFEMLLFTSGDDIVTFIDDQNHVLDGNSGNDVVNGGNGNDTIDGGAGNDTLNGGFGNDVYRFGRGSGHDTIIDSGIGEWWRTGSGDDTVVLKDGLTRSDLIITVEGNDLLIGIKEGNKPFEELSDTLRIVGALNSANPFESFGFANGAATTSDILSNQAPDASSEVFHTLQDVRVLSGNVGAMDGDGDILSYTVSTEALHGILGIDETGAWSYAATEGYMGIDTAIMTVDDGNGGTATQTLTFDLRVSAPTLADSVAGLLEDTSASGTFNVTNPIGGTLVYEVLNTSAKGAFSVNEAGAWSYAPNANLNGTDSVTLKVTNAYGLSTMATLSFAIEAVNDAPILIEEPSVVKLYAGTNATGTIRASDVDADVLSYSVTTAPAHGNLNIDATGAWSYTAERYYAGESSATVMVDDGHGCSVVATLDFTNLMTPDWHYTYGGQEMTINDGDGVDLLVMDSMSMADLTFMQEGNNLRVDVKDRPDVLLSDYFASVSKGVESILTQEGEIDLRRTTINATTRIGPFVLGSAADDLMSGTVNNDRTYGRDGNDILFGQAGDDRLYGDAGNDLLIGGDGADILSGDDGDDTLYGDSGDDILSGGTGNDRLIGGMGTNTLLGGSGNDTYVFGKVANATTIEDKAVAGNGNMYNWNTNSGYDTIAFRQGVTKEDISFLTKGNDLLIQYGGNETITIKNQKSQANQIEKLQLDDGSYLSNTDIDQIIQQINAYSKDHGFHLKDNTQIQNNQALMNIIASGWHQ